MWLEYVEELRVDFYGREIVHLDGVIGDISEGFPIFYPERKNDYHSAN